MGYRSEVAFCLRVKEPEKFIALSRIDADDVLKEMLDNMYYYEDTNGDKTKYILFTHNYWKWYDDSERALHKLMQLAENYDEDFACKFARSGEESNDIEEESYGENGWDLMYPYVVRAVETGVKPEELTKIIKEEEHATTS
jgi:hypothetical protein